MASMKEVAKLAGVSNATVSRVLSNKPNVSESLRQRVMAAVEELNYQPDLAAQRLRNQSQHTNNVIGLLIGGLHDSHFNVIVDGVSDLAYDHDLTLLLCNTRAGTRESYYLERMRAERVAGVVVNPHHYYQGSEQLEKLREDGTAVILLDTTIENSSFDLVQVDNRQGAYQATRHLIQLGHHPATIAGPAAFSTAQGRLQGYLDALRDENVPVDKTLIAEGDYEPPSGYAAMKELLCLPQPPTAVFCANNSMSLGALEALKEQDITIGQDIAFVTYDDVPWMRFMNPGLTSVAQPIYSLGREAVRLLLRRIAEPDAPQLTVTLPTELKVRGSCGSDKPDHAHQPG